MATDPLQELLQSLALGTSFTSGQLAARLGVSLELLMGMLHHLECLGYVRPLRISSCQESCQTCQTQGKCGMHLWTLADKGRRAVSEVML
jgi:hypothetical protein